MNGIEKGRKWNKRGKGRERRKRKKKKEKSFNFFSQVRSSIMKFKLGFFLFNKREKTTNKQIIEIRW